MRKTKYDNDLTNRIGTVYSENETKLSSPTNWVWSKMKTRQDNDVTEWTSVVYAKNDIELS